jgi:gamma-glutamyl:cysteine ligase YbdK (ATP-grasp superfamily)
MTDLSELIDRLMPVARELGEDKYLVGFQPLEKWETGSDQQRRHYREAGNWKGLVDFMTKQLLDDLESNKKAAP